MKYDKIIEELSTIAKELKIKIRKVNNIESEGLCIIDKKKIILLNKNSSLSRTMHTLAVSLYEAGIDNIYVKPVIREIIEKEVNNKQARGTKL